MVFYHLHYFTIRVFSIVPRGDIIIQGPLYMHLFLLAEEMIRKWLDKVEKESIMDAAAASIAQSHPHIGIPATPSHTSLSSHASTGLGTEDSRDLLSMVDWESGSIAQTTKSILDILMTKKIPRLPLLNHPKSHDPRVAMEMRHKQVCDSVNSFDMEFKSVTQVRKCTLLST